MIVAVILLTQYYLLANAVDDALIVRLIDRRDDRLTYAVVEAEDERLVRIEQLVARLVAVDDCYVGQVLDEAFVDVFGLHLE